MEILERNASVNMLSVTIQALKVEGKQMTLALFRQLPISTENSEAEYWGVVHYSIADQGDKWIVFSQNGRLFKRALDLRAPYLADKAYLLRKDLKALESGGLNTSRLRELIGLAQSEESYEERKARAASKLRDGIEREETIARQEFESRLEQFKREQRLAGMVQLFIAA